MAFVAGDLNVVFHGSFAFVVNENCIEVLIPEVSLANSDCAHQYRGGPTAAVTNNHTRYGNLGAASYYLSGVRKNPLKRFPAEKFPVVEGFKVIDRAAGVLKCSLYLPFPNTITPLRYVKTDAANWFGGAASEQIFSKGIPYVYVLSYTFDDFNVVHLDALWRGTGRSMNFHVFAEPPRPAAGAPPLPDDHPKRAFHLLTRMFPGLDLRLKRQEWKNLGTNQQVPDGVTPDERRSLSDTAPPADVAETPLCISLVVDNT